MTVMIASINDESAQITEIMKQAGIACLNGADAANEIEFIVDFTPESASEKAARLMQYSDSGARVVLCSTLCCTATDVMGRLDNRLAVIGVNGLPALWLDAKAVEIAPAMQCPPEAVEKVEALLRSVGITPERTEDRIGLVSARILSTLINEAAFAVMEHVASPQDIDAAMKLGVNYPKGLLEWGDELGLDRIVLILDALYGEYHQERYRACVLMKQLVRAGFTGRKAGRGFFDYTGK